MADREYDFHKTFASEWKKLQETGILTTEVMKEFRTNAENIRNSIPLLAKYKDHPLHGGLKDCRDFHLINDIVVIYQVTETLVRFLRIGTHSNLFAASSQ